MKKTGLSQRVIEALGLDNGMVKDKYTPLYQRPLVKDTDGKLPSGMFSYSSAIGMLIYLSGHTLPDKFFTVNCCARYMFFTKISHKLALERLAK